jgi:hypothetical protein
MASNRVVFIFLFVLLSAATIFSSSINCDIADLDEPPRQPHRAWVLNMGLRKEVGARGGVFLVRVWGVCIANGQRVKQLEDAWPRPVHGERERRRLNVDSQFGRNAVTPYTATSPGETANQTARHDPTNKS